MENNLESVKGASSQGYHTNQACYKSGIMSPEYIANRGIQLIGVDYLSVGSFKHSGRYVHKTLLSSGIWTIEGLNLSDVTPGKYNLICLPLRIVGGDGAPARAIIKPMVSN